MPINKKQQGKQNRAKGKLFETKVRADLEKQGWIVAKWTNQVEFKIASTETDEGISSFVSHQEKIGRLVPIKPKFNPFTKSVMYTGTGFPDYIAFKELITEAQNDMHQLVYGNEVIGIECKGGNETNHYLDKEEKEKCNWLLANVFSKILIATKGKKRGQIIYTEFK